MGKNRQIRPGGTSTKGKAPEIAQNPDAYLSLTPSWQFHRCDINYKKWSINNVSFYDVIYNKLISYEGLTWAEIQAASGGKNHGTNNHFENISEMSKEAKDRVRKLNLDVDQLFSLRLFGRMRLYGIIDRGVFQILWLDQNHEIYPLQK